MAKSLISIIVPVYNEQEAIPHFYRKLMSVLGTVPTYDFEILYIDDGSTDQSSTLLEELAARDERIKYIQLSRNFGKEVATTAGLNLARGTAAVLIDADLQHPPLFIPHFIAKWEAGAEVVIGVRNTRHEEFLSAVGSSLFYAILRRISDTEIIPHATDFRLLDRHVIDAFNRFTEKSRLTRGLIDWLGFRRVYVPFHIEKRQTGRPRYTVRKRFKLALSSFVAHSLFPLKVTGYLGLIIVLFSGPLGLYIFFDKYILNNPFGFNFSGPAILAVINLFLSGITLSSLGLIALYIGSIHEEVTNRPLYVIRKKQP
ncbi:MAG: glycosyltransferase family 2 protein [Candidatus Andersenbacteria bacterium]